MFPWLHPTIVHFAIALVFASVLFDVVGLVRDSEPLRFAGFCNLIGGAISVAAATATGTFADGQLGPHSELGGALLRVHLFAGWATAIGVLSMLALRLFMRGHIRKWTRTAYLTVSFLTLALVFLTGGIGGSLVYRYGLGLGPVTARAILEAQPAPDAAAHAADSGTDSR